MTVSRRIWILSAVSIVTGLLPAVSIAAAEPCTLAVASFAVSSRAPADVGTKLSDLLSVALSGREGIALVERVELDRVLAEHRLNTSGLVSVENAIRFGRLTGAQLVLTGRVLDIGKRRTVVGRLISCETMQVAGVTLRVSVTAALDELAEELAERLAATLAEKRPVLLPSAASVEEQVALAVGSAGTTGVLSGVVLARSDDDAAAAFSALLPRVREWLTCARIPVVGDGTPGAFRLQLTPAVERLSSVRHRACWQAAVTVRLRGADATVHEFHEKAVAVGPDTTATRDRAVRRVADASLRRVVLAVIRSGNGEAAAP